MSPVFPRNPRNLDPYLAQEMQDQMDEDQRIHEELREQYSHQERKLNILISELEEVRSSLESNERARKLVLYVLI